MKQAVILVTALFVTPVLGEENKFTIMGPGAQPCAKFAEMFQTDPQTAENLYFSWAQGYLSGMNMERILERKPPYNLSSMGVDSQERFLRQYCDRHPLADYMTAVTALQDQLKISN